MTYKKALQSNKILLLIVLPILLIFCLSTTSAYLCYQESANVSNQVGTDGTCGIYTGLYSFSPTFFYINYTKPYGAINSSLWQVRFGSDGTKQYYENDSLENCFSGYSDKIVLRFFSNKSTTNSYGESYGQCYNSTNWFNVTTNSKITAGVDGGSGSSNKERLAHDGLWLSYSSTRESAVLWDLNTWSDTTLNTVNSSNYKYAAIWEEGIIWNITELIVGNSIYNNNTYESTTENLYLNYTISNTVISSSAVLYYNNTAYPSTTTCNGGYCYASNSISIPLINTGQVNNSFYWTVTASNGTANFVLNSSSYNQSVNQISLTYCTTGTIAMNFTAYDEQSKARLKPFDFEGTFIYSTSPGGLTRNLSISNTTAIEVDLCINKNTTIYIDAIISYINGTYPIRNYFYQSYPINNVTKHVPLYLLNTASSTSFILQVQDRNLQAVPQVLVNAQKCYPGTNNNETVFIHRTDSSGLTIGNLEAETALYQFFITNQSNTILSVTPCAKVVPQTSPYTLLFQLGGGYISPFNNIMNASNIESTFSFNSSNNILTWTYIDTSGIFNYSELVVSSLNYSGNNPIVCDSNNTLSSGIITCNVTGSGTYSAMGYVIRSNQILFTQFIFTAETRSGTAGYYGVFLAFFLIIIASFAFKFNEIAGIALINIVVIFCNIVGLVNFGVTFITAMIGISIIIVGVLER